MYDKLGNVIQFGKSAVACSIPLIGCGSICEKMCCPGSSLILFEIYEINTNWHV